MTLPWGFPFECSVLRDGREETAASEESRKAILLYDPDFDKRKEFQKEFEIKILLPLGLFLHKYPVLKEILIKEPFFINITLLNIIQDAFRQNASDLNEIMLAFIRFLNRCKGYYLPLFRERAHHKIIDVSLSAASTERRKILQLRKEEIDTKRATLFPTYNSKGNPSADCFERIKEKASSVREIVKTYRDKVSAHHDEEKPTISWNDLDVSINQFKMIVDNLYIVGSFNLAMGRASGPGFSAKKTVEILLSGIEFEKST